MTRILWGSVAVFVVFGLLQLNDPDPGFWVFVYGITALYSAAAARGRMSRAAALVWGVLALCFAAATLALPGTTSTMGPSSLGPLADERVREGLGLVVVGLWSFVLAWHSAPVGAVSDKP